MTVKVSESDSQLVSVPTSESAPWTNLIQSSVPGLSFLFEVTGKPWTAGLGVLGLVLAATIAGLLGFGGGMRDRVRGSENYNYYADFQGRSGTTRHSNCPSSATEIIDCPSTFYSSLHPDYNPRCDSPFTCTSSYTSTCANPQNILSSSCISSSSPAGMIMAAPGPSLDAALRVAREFDLPSDQVQRGVDEFLNQMAEGLAKNGTTLSQIPTYVTSVPNGTEKGLYLAVDLGGTNFRVCSINLRGDSTFDLTQNKVAIPRDMMVAPSYKELFKFLATQIEIFLEQHHNDHFEATVRRRRLTGTTDQYRREEIFDLGFTFSFPVHQTSINRGTLIRWTKGFDIPDAVGKDVCLMLQDAINELHLPVRVAALVNDTVGTLMARSYTSPGKTETLLGAIFGTGTNGAYVENLDKVTKLDVKNDRTIDKTKNQMVINTEWGSFDNHLSVLPNTIYDQQLDAESVNPGIQMFEKRVSGMFLGEILRRAILALTQDSEAKLLQNDGSSIPSGSPLYQTWGIDTSFLSIIEADNTPDLAVTKIALFEHFNVDNATTDDAQAVKAIGHAIAKRAARLSAIALAAILIDTKRINTDETVDIGVDGSLVEFYPKFVDYMREALREVKGIGEKESKVKIGIAKDGSGVGAALIALVAHKEHAMGSR
ncbi:glucokinase [Talaromyces marneffei ATCC 18224]